MRIPLFIASLLISTLTFSQKFFLAYEHVGLGSNATWYLDEKHRDCAEGFKLGIVDSLMMFSNCERDTAGNQVRVHHYDIISQTAIDNILSHIDSVKGKSLFWSNTGVMSGGVHYLHIAYEETCTTLMLKNAYNPLFEEIAEILNDQLPSPFEIYSNKRFEITEGSNNPVVTPCTDQEPLSYGDILGKEFQYIQLNAR